ncbi:hypothetical protein GLYMA_04G217600v4 [Glycine max]|nr:hypothetical protein GLYMA_04G217600v4 [Glycine max]KAH1112555.1 hypothetical protein GYH30_010699 [Glycine max]
MSFSSGLEMASSQNKRILFVAFVILCLFSSPTIAARTLKEKSNLTSGDVNTVQHNKEAIAKVFKPKDEDVNVGGDVFSMDYTPASRKPPIHN